ncbi:hypothetical protein [Caulobacter henricii]|uniref:Uncharacterized protein n=1 Tax=Caulobacter henricii TaxID=69395 RepID=A0A0P0NXJ7_9CAUL|nr:hypothetical protein [Caulobacter henricii]ALL12787.1 hypothetical protein AQ619_05115 [Caulobacter henricii]
MPRHRSPRPRRASKGPSRPHRHAWLTAALVKKISALADMIELKRAECDVDMASIFQGGRVPPGPSSREAPCDAEPNTPSMPR